MNESAVKHDKLMLSRLQLFRNVDLDEPALDGLLSTCAYREMVVGDLLLSPETQNHYLYVIISGRLVIHLGPHDDVPLTMVEPGECVGEMSIIDSRVPSAQVSASEPTRVLEIGQEVLWRMVSISHEIAHNLLYIMSERLRYSHLIIAEHHPGDSHENLIAAAEIAMYHAKKEGRNCVRVALDHETAQLVASP